VKSIALEGVDDHGGLHGVFEVSEAELDLGAVFAVSGDQPKLFEADERSEDIYKRE
jgi:hypothetical protein